MANEGAYGGLGGMGAGAGLGFALGGPAGAMLGAGIGGSAGGLIGGLFGGSPKAPDISGELANIRALFEQLRAQNEVNINRQAAQGRTQAANNMAGRGVYRSPVSNVGFDALENERLNSIATSNAQLAGQEAGVRAGLLSQLLGLNRDYQMMGAQADASRTGAITGLAGNLLVSQLLKSPAAPKTAGYTPSFNMQSPAAAPNFTDILRAKMYGYTPSFNFQANPA